MSALPRFEDDPLAYIKNLDRLFDEAAIAPARFKVQSAAKFVDPTHNDDPFEERQPAPEPLAANRVQSAADFMGALVPREWSIKDLQPLDAQLCVVYGDSTTGKSFFMIDVGCAIHRGAPWNGRPTRKGRVIYLCAEGSGDFRYRLHAYAKHHGIDPAQMPMVIDNAPDLFDEKSALKVIEQIHAAGGCETLIIDTLSATFTGNENGSEMGVYLNNIKRIRRACCKTVWLVAHSGKDASKGIRGWSGTRAAIDVEIEVTKDDSGLRTARSTKMKSGIDGAKWNFRLKVVPLMHETDSCVIEYTSEQAKPRAKELGAQQRLMLDALRELGPMGERIEIAEVINLAWHRGGIDTETSPDARPPNQERKNMTRALKSIPASYNVVIDGKFASIGNVKLLTEEDDSK